MHPFVVKDVFDFIADAPAPQPDPGPEPIRAPQKEWDAVYHAAAQLNPLSCCLVELRDRVVALEAAGSVAGNPGNASAAPAGVTIHELTRALERIGCDSTHAQFLWNHPRIGPLLRGEGAPAPKRVVLAEEPPAADVPRSWSRIVNGPQKLAWKKGHAAGWAACRAEVERQQQGGQADG